MTDKKIIQKKSNHNKSSHDLFIAIFLLAIVAFGIYYLISIFFGGTSSGNLNEKTIASSIVPTLSISESDLRELDLPENNYLGNINSNIEVQIFTDLKCTYCKTLHDSLDDIVSKYGDKVKFTFRSFPLASHNGARNGAIAAECAKMQGNFFEYMDESYQNFGYLVNDNLLVMAESIGLDSELFSSCLVNQDVANKVDEMKKTGITMGVKGTPTVFINSKKLISWEPKLIDKELLALTK